MMERLRLELGKLMGRVDELSLRERALVFLGVLALMFIGAENLVIKPLSDQRTRLEQELKTRRDQTQAVERQMQTLLTGDLQEADATKRVRLDSLRGQLNGLEAELGKATSGLVTPREMGRLVEQFLAGKRGLEVIKVESLAPEPLTNEVPKPGETRAANTAAGSGALIYKHGMRIELRGSYLDMLAYLKGLEGLPWKVFWGQVSLQSDKYPVSRMTLVIFTLNTREGWIGI